MAKKKKSDLQGGGGGPATVAIPKKRAAKKTAKGATAALAANGSPKIDPNQKQLPGVEDDRIAPIETIVKKVVDMKSQRAALKEEIETLLAKLPPLFDKHKLNSYSCYGKLVVIEPGASIVKIKAAKQQ